MKSSKQKVTSPSQLDRMFQVDTRAPLSLSQLLQSHALLPTGNSVPLASKAYYPWISSALDAKGIQLGHLIRHLSHGYETINLRIAHPSPQIHIIDLAVPFHPPSKVKPKLHQTLEKIFQLDETKSKALGARLVDAFLQNHIPSALVITSECRHEAVAKIRKVADPSRVRSLKTEY